MILAIMGTAAIMITIIWAMMQVRGIDAFLGIYAPRNVELKIHSNPTKYDAMILTFLEYEHEGIPMKKILNAVAIQDNTNIWIDDKWIDVKLVSEEFLGREIDRPYLLKIRDPELEIASSGDEIVVMGIQKVSQKVFLLDGEGVDLELYIG